MLQLGQSQPQQSKFGITIQLRDKKGNLTGRIKSHHSDSAEDIAAFWERNQPRIQKKKKSNPKNLPSKDQADKLLAEVAEYAEEQQQKRDRNGA